MKHKGEKMKEDEVTIEFKHPWAMMPLECADEWINAVKGSLIEGDPLFGKDIFVSGRHECEQQILIENDSDNNYAIVSVMPDGKSKISYKTIEIIASRVALAERLSSDHKEAMGKYN